MDVCLPLSALLSHALVAFTIEFDNEAERQMPHRTTNHGSTNQSVAKHASTAGSLHAPWLVSMVMWSNCMQFVGEKGVAVRELQTLARTKTNLNGMERWGYIVVAPNPARGRPKPRRSEWLIRATPAGRKAQEIWRPLFGVIEKRWQERFGEEEIKLLRKSLGTLVSQLDVELPDCLPILGYGLFSRGAGQTYRPSSASITPVTPVSDLHLPALLSKVLLAFAIEFERDSEVSLAISANILRLVGEEGVRMKDLPRSSAVSKEAIATAVSFLGKRGYAVVKPESPDSRVKVVVLTARGRHAQDAYRQLVRTIEERWLERFGKDIIRAVRDALEQLVGDPTPQQSRLFRGLEPNPDGWRASVPKPEALPHYPMVLHRGGFPDGS